MSELNDRNYRISETDIPWTKHLESEKKALPLPRGVQAVIPDPEGKVPYLYVDHDQYVMALGDLGRLTYDPNQNISRQSTGVSQEEQEAWAEVSGYSPYILGHIGLREQVRIASHIGTETEIANSDVRHPEPKEGEQ